VRVFENRVLRMIGGGHMGLGEYEVTGEWRLHNEGLNDLYSSVNIVWLIKSKRMQWTGHVWGKERYIQGFGGKTQRKETTWKTHT
jgi:hypothetical protein